MSENQNEGSDLTKSTTSLSYEEAVQLSMQLIRTGLDNEFLVAKSKGSVFIGDPELILTRIGIGIIREKPQEILEFSTKSHDHFNAIKNAVADIIERDAVIPAEVRTWVSGVLKGNIKCPPRRRGKPSKDWSSAVIWLTVKNLVDNGMTATRNDASATISACDVVADALSNLALTPQTFERVKKIWQEFNKLDECQVT